MARRSRSGGNNPNTVLVVFLVIFVLTNIALGVWLYTMYQERDKWQKDAADKDAQVKGANLAAEWNKYKSDELRAAIGDPGFNKSDYLGPWLEQRKNKETKFQNESDYDEFLRVITFLEDKLGGFGDTNYRNKLAELHGPWRELAEQKSKALAAAEAENKAIDARLRSEIKKYDTELERIKTSIKKGNLDAMEARKEQNKAVTEAFKQNEDLRKEIEDRQTIATEELRKRKDLAIKNLDEKLKQQIALAQNPNRALSEPHALMLDISRGKTLWDLPRGKITRLDDEAKRVYINKGAKDGIQPGLTFNVFAASWNGRGEGPLKATIEVVRVEDDHTALCKVNSYYDIDGSEIPTNAAAPGKILRDGATALKEGDFIFNLLWGSHIAIAGVVDVDGTLPTTGAAQMDALLDFMRHLERMGLIIDSYIDLRDGKVQGQLSPKTNYLIRGSNAYQASADAKDERVAAINASIKSIREQAVDRGVFIISPENFAAVTGFRRAGSADNRQILNFTPARPTGGTVTSNPLDAQQPPNDGKKN